jgi:hypothetical protein
LLRDGAQFRLGGLIDMERALAAHAFFAALGVQPPDYQPRPLLKRWEVLECLTHECISVGLARGEHHARELMRDIESQAAAQARRHQGPAPSR